MHKRELFFCWIATSKCTQLRSRTLESKQICTHLASDPPKCPQTRQHPLRWKETPRTWMAGHQVAINGTRESPVVNIGCTSLSISEMLMAQRFCQTRLGCKDFTEQASTEPEDEEGEETTWYSPAKSPLQNYDDWCIPMQNLRCPMPRDQILGHRWGETVSLWRQIWTNQIILWSHRPSLSLWLHLKDAFRHNYNGWLQVISWSLYTNTIFMMQCMPLAKKFKDVLHKQ